MSSSAYVRGMLSLLLLVVALVLRRTDGFVVPTSSRRQTTPGVVAPAEDGRRAIASGDKHYHNTYLHSSTSTSDSTSTASTSSYPKDLDEKQKDFTMGYLNKHHRSTLLEFVQVFTEIGGKVRKRNTFSGGSYKLLDAKVLDISLDEGRLTLEVTAKDRSEADPVVEQTVVSLEAQPKHRSRSMSDKAIPLDLIPPPTKRELEADSAGRHPVDELVRKLNRLCWMVEAYGLTGKLIQMGIQIGGTGVGELHENMYLNQIPHNRPVRKYFYEMISKATMEAVIDCANGERSNRMKITALFPEMNPQVDSYRIGTLLEMARCIAIRLAEENLRVRVCIQGSMGVGIFMGTPKPLSGASQIMQAMDWQSDEGEENEGMVGNYVNFGAVGPEHVANEVKDEEGNIVTHQDDVFLLLCPQSMVGTDTSIMPSLQAMTEAVGDRPIILLNPDLVDKVSAAGQQSVRGRAQRIEFAESFQDIFHFTNLHWKTAFFPILGALTKLRPNDPWVAHQRRDLVNDGGELYVPLVASETKPSSEVIMEAMDMAF
eukprot:CAMPEP_0194041438 /NCGR_PEP_ID=MMETSP0009_2-20130614/13349_1 /TAXON_ID=210454 /ORGANISM="Grammatophora oceanica, Strain CCMP 410" /LENGTH=541 /DNA_ID=CAMNT_0038684951 /DNA_START=15 /DNA_END=1640 /DNA_ORIENTATION=+